MNDLDKAIKEIKELREHDEGVLSKHKQRHIELHKAVDELFADFIRNNPTKLPGYINLPIVDLVTWSAKQIESPDHEEN
jgi:hypothetical protein